MALARAQFDAALKAHPDNPDFYLRIATICKRHKQLDLGIEYIRQGLDACKDQSKADRAQLHSTLAMLLDEAQPAQPQEAIQEADKALELAPDDPAMLNLAGYLRADHDQELDRAQGYLTRALRLAAPKADTPSGALLLSMIEDSYGWVLYKQKNYGPAVDALQQAIEDLPENSLEGDDLKVFYYHLGAASRKAGLLEEARRAISIALSYDSSYAPAKAEQAQLAAASAAVPPAVGRKPATSPAPAPSLTPIPGASTTRTAPRSVRSE